MRLVKLLHAIEEQAPSSKAIVEFRQTTKLEENRTAETASRKTQKNQTTRKKRLADLDLTALSAQIGTNDLSKSTFKLKIEINEKVENVT